MTKRASTRRLGVLAMAAALLLAACGGDDTADGPAAAAEPNTMDAADTGDDAAAAAADEDSADDTAAATTDPEPADSEQAAAGDGIYPKPEVELPAEPPTVLVVTDLLEGSGDPADFGDTIELHYVGVLTADGTEFDNSYDSGQPIQVKLGTTGVIAGFAQGLLGVQQGARIQMDIPAALAYGDQGAGDIIKPGDAVTFVVDVIEVTKPVPVTAPPMADPGDCPATDGSEPQTREFSEYPPFCIDVDKTYTAEVSTNFGDITIELDPQKAPLTVNSFVTLAWFRYFDGTECHRAIPSFVVQCGDPTATGTGGPGYRFPDELPNPGEYEIGSIAMANSGPDTNGSQFFIITGAQGAALPPQYSLFGKVIAGETTVSEMDGVANPQNNGVPPRDQIIIQSVTITES